MTTLNRRQVGASLAALSTGLMAGDVVKVASARASSSPVRLPALPDDVAATDGVSQ